MATRNLLPAVWEVPQVFRDRLGESPGRQRAMSAEGHLLLVLHCVPAPEDDVRHARFFWRKPDGTWLCDGQGSGVAALDAHLDTYRDAVDALEKLEEIAQNADQYFEVIHPLAPLHRAARNMYATLQHARESVPEARELILCRDRAYEIDREAELLYKDAKASLDLNLARRAEQQAASSHRMSVAAHRLNVLAAFFFPIATLSTVFGVNLQHGMETANSPYLFFGVLGAGLAAGLVLKSFIVRAP